MRTNRGATSLKRRRRAADPMKDYDRLPRDLREWTARAMLPWGARSVRVAYEKALRRTGSAKAALAELDRLQQDLIAKDAKTVWGNTYPNDQKQRRR